MKYDDQIEKNGSGRMTLTSVEALKKMNPERRKQAIHKLLKRVAEEMKNEKPTSSRQLAELEENA